MGRLSGKVAVITGTSSGIGRAAAIAFAREGARVVGCGINVERSRAVTEEVRALGGDMVSLQPVDLSLPTGAGQLINFALEHYGAIDILYNNAGMAYFEPFPEMAYETFARTLREEVDIVFLLTKEAWPHLVARGGGSIINAGSIAARIGARGQGAIAHIAAKGAVVAMTRQLAVDGAAHNIRANTLSPGVIRTAQTEPFIDTPGFRDMIASSLLVPRVGEVEDVANCAIFLASDESGYVTGTDMLVDGGYTAL